MAFGGKLGRLVGMDAPVHLPTSWEDMTFEARLDLLLALGLTLEQALVDALLISPPPPELDAAR